MSVIVTSRRSRDFHAPVCRQRPSVILNRLEGVADPICAGMQSARRLSVPRIYQRDARPCFGLTLHPFERVDQLVRLGHEFGRSEAVEDEP